MSVLKEFYDVSEDWRGKRYAGINLDWDYKKREVHMSIPGYVKEAFARFKHILRKTTDQPHKHELPKYGSTIKYAKEEDTTQSLNKKDKRLVQQITG